MWVDRVFEKDVIWFDVHVCNVVPDAPVKCGNERHSCEIELSVKLKHRRHRDMECCYCDMLHLHLYIYIYILLKDLGVSLSFLLAFPNPSPLTNGKTQGRSGRPERLHRWMLPFSHAIKNSPQCRHHRKARAQSRDSGRA